MSPEQWTDPLSVGPAADLYALGVVAYECVDRHASVRADVGEATRTSTAAEVPPLGEASPPALDGFFARAMAKRPEDRPPTAL